MVSAVVSNIGTQKASTAAKSVDKADLTSGSDFRKIMNSSLAGNAGNTETRRNSVSTDTFSNQDNKTNFAADNSKVAANKQVDNNKNVDHADDKVSGNVNQHSDNDVQAVDADGEKLQAVENAIDDIKNVIKDEFDISEEDIINAMQTLGLTPVDLLNVDNISKLVEVATGNEDPLLFVTDGDMLAKLNEVVGVVEAQLEGLSEELSVPENSVYNESAKLIMSGADAMTDKINGAEFTNQQENVMTASVDDRTFAKEIKEDKGEDTTKVDGTNNSQTLSDVIREKITVNTQGGNNGNQNKDMGAKDNSHNAIDMVSNNLAQSISDSFENVINSQEMSINEVDVARQVIDSVRMTANQQLQSIEVVLNPENLGRVNVTVSMKEGMLTAQLTAQNEQVRKALENQMVILKENFQNQGIKVEAVEVTVQSHAFEANPNLNGNNNSEQGNNNKNARRTLNLDSLNELSDDELSEDELRAKDSITNGNSSVVYRA